MSPHARNLLQIHAAVLLFGLAGCLGKMRDLSPFVLVLGRVVFASLALLAASAWWKLPLRPRPARTLLPFLALGALLAVHWTTFFQSVRLSSVALALITYSTFPVFVAFLEPLLFREPLRRIDVVLAGVALAGVVVLQPTFVLGDRTTRAVLWGVASGLTFALLSLLNRRYVRHHSSVTIALYQDAFAALVLLPLVVRERPALTGWDLLLLAVLGVLCTAVAHSLFIAGMHGVRARTASMIACLEPVYGTLLALAVLGEVPSARTVAGGVVILGVAFYATAHAAREKAAKEVRS